MKLLLTLSALFIFATTTLSQDAPVPEYLTKQILPDSVRSLGMTTPEGKRTTLGEMLDSHKGKKVLIDIWATWCRDCIVGYPKLDQLRNEIGEEKVVWIFLSTDNDPQKWKTGITRFNIRGEHYLLDGAWQNTLSNYIVLDWVPRYLVLDESGMIIMPKAIVAEDKAVREALR